MSTVPNVPADSTSTVPTNAQRSRAIPIAVGVVLLALVVALLLFVVSKDGREGNFEPGSPSRMTGGTSEKLPGR